jgi:hypothetical protein
VLVCSLTAALYLDLLMSEEVLNMEQFDQIGAERTPQDKCRKLLSIMHVKSEPVIEVFVDKLQVDFPHLHGILLEQSAVIERQEQETAERKKQELEMLKAKSQLLPQVKQPATRVSPKGYCCIVILSRDVTTDKQATTLLRLFEYLGLSVVTLYDVNATRRVFTAKVRYFVI